MAGKIIADIIEAPYDSIRMNVGNVTVLTANNSGLTYTPTGNVNINVGSTVSLTLGNVTVSSNISTGNISASGVIIPNNGIRFPATQVASGDANTLDDYEEGTSSGNLISNSGTFTSATYASRYRKIGSLVLLSFEATITSVGSASLGFIIPLPFTADGVFGYSGTGRRMSDSVQFHVVLSNTIYAVARNTASGGTLQADSTDYRGMIVYHAV